MILLILPLLISLPVNFGTALQEFHSSPPPSPWPLLATENHPEHVTTTLMSAWLAHFIAARKLHVKYLSSSPAPSPVSQDCSHTCALPLTATPFGSPCFCVVPMRVKLLLGVPLYSIFPVVTELEIEVAAGTYLMQSQVRIMGAISDQQDPQRAVVDLNLVPLGEKFDNTTAILTYQRFFYKKVVLNRTLFGDYDVIYIDYPVSGGGSSGSPGNVLDPVSVNLPSKRHKKNIGIILVIAFSTIAFLAACVAAAAALLKCRKVQRPSKTAGLVLTSLNRRSAVESMLSSSPANSPSAAIDSALPPSILSVKMFTLAELKIATENFSSRKLLGEGGFGRVFEGTMQGGNTVAVKLLKRDDQNGDREFIAEIEMLSRLHHRNLVKLIGMCIDKSARCLVYELVHNGSVESHLHGADRSKGILGWDARLKIALGAARGLAYLHEDSNPRVIHRDFKASNVLLEDDFTPKVSDFGLAREATEGSRHISTQVMGTFGYVAPEYAMTGHLLVKSDVYSYGVVLLELLSGRKPVDMSQPPGQENLVTWARPLLTNPVGIEQLVDPTLARTFDFDDLAKVAAIATMCVHPEVSERPFMGEVVQALKLIYNDTDKTGDDECSPQVSGVDDLELRGNLDLSESSWWNAGDLIPCRQASTFTTMEYCLDVVDSLMFPTMNGSQTDPPGTMRCNPIFSGSTRSISSSF
ncbi:receptor-like serine/threonine-protein kinase ALE2 isoform X2 [Andrographis paniculata]|uniref:receptor-like serine/threonine-protein kinase ALE2 isoform X2 n=1 Tax=Andrographis paniculata TaxID=175694 RepID=UPI0021E83667|nr:receptor-like serine/threonine-protein kinase ALE2 isoform X2 [Andrographis paniculata]